MKPFLSIFFVFISSPALAWNCTDFRGLYFRSDSTGNYHIRIHQVECESVTMTVMNGPYGSQVPFRFFSNRLTPLSLPLRSASELDSVSTAIFSNSLLLIRTTAAESLGAFSLSRVAEIYRKQINGGISVEVNQLTEELPSTQKWENHTIQFWTRIGD